MMTVFRRASVRGALVSLALASGIAAAQNAPTAFQRQMERVDFGISGMGFFTPSNSGSNYLHQNVAQVPSSAFGPMFDLRYTRSPLVGFQLNYGYVRLNENYTVTNGSGTPAGEAPYQLGVVNRMTEYSFGYVAHLPTFYGISPIVGAGLGGLKFQPTAGGGQNVEPQARTGIYYSIGGEKLLYSHLGARAQIRQLFYGAPDFNENYLANGARSISTEPAVGFFLRF